MKNGWASRKMSTTREVIVEAAISLDGGMGGENSNFWKETAPFRSADVTEYLNDLLFMPDALLIGKKTYELFAQVWPARQGEDADRINSLPKYVASRTLKSGVVALHYQP
jgi:dihydrofolate reductase